jgi:hypothetical protein
MAIAFLFVVALIFDAKSKKPRSHRGFGGILSFFYYCFCDPLRFSTSAANENQ